MESTEADSLTSPASILVSLVAILFVLHRTWAHLAHSKASKVTGFATVHSPSNADLTVSKEPEIPEGWWNSREVFELERRALFSQTWLYISHSSQFHKPGSYQSFDVAGFPVFLIRGKDDKIRAFHNVCRHRAYTITKKETGASTILGCRYHGWSYNTTGRLVKAPHFDDVPGFDKSQNSLFEVHTHTTDQGLIFVNLDSGEPTAFDSELASTLRGFAHIAGLEAKSTWVTGQTLSGDFNWKIGARYRQLDVYISGLHRRMRKISGPSPIVKLVRSITRNSTREECFLFPITLMYLFQDTGLFLALSFFPVSESKTNIRYDLFTRSTVSEPNIRQMSEALQSATKKLTEEIELEYQSMSARQGSSGEFNNTADTRQILSRLQEHTKLERIEGGQILPAMHKPEGSTLFQKADQLCKELDCVSGRSQNGTSLSAFDW
ncbi:Aromatic-ring-hydroxylating dioxygenase alpha subunit [Penicillium cf. griseofulvum]|uniref:Aromatic-ring-hydroxylating dioxygenase alpha subunit n=1 Tax=Penicillium cf. griseofulvum TaxID=2972120 RepID=A0A9W9MQ35_9EURO|nr:Aromatic-ring-hydroxylating dioxygenase alpha subunit [Penicillium cf. griseofulvum]KAJ5441582.1 Aromatic-ring-hydroxylating dioxygenase alpha subunit [Penicillium cf. griseofulvum]